MQNYSIFFLNFSHFAILAATMIPLHFGIKKRKEKKTKVAMHFIIMFNFFKSNLFLFLPFRFEITADPTYHPEPIAEMVLRSRTGIRVRLKKRKQKNLT